MAAAAKAKQFLECAYRIDNASPTLVATSNDLFDLKKAITPKELPDFQGGVQITENSSQRSSKVSASFGIEGSYYAFSGAAEGSLEHYNASSTKTIRADHDLFAIKYVCQNNVLDCSEFLRADVINFVKKAKVEKIVKKLGHFYATEVTLGGHMQLTRIIKARSEDTADSLSASINASYGNALVGSVKANASGSSESKSALEDREETCDLSVQGGDVKHWLQFDGSSESKNTCQTAWAAGIKDSSLYPLKMQLSPIWEAFSEHSELEAKAAELKKYLLSKWKSEYAHVAALKKKAGNSEKIMAALDKAESNLQGCYNDANYWLKKTTSESTKRNTLAEQASGNNLKNVQKLKKSFASEKIKKKGVVEGLQKYEALCAKWHTKFNDWGGHDNTYAASCHGTGQKVFHETLEAVLQC